MTRQISVQDTKTEHSSTKTIVLTKGGIISKARLSTGTPTYGLRSATGCRLEIVNMSMYPPDAKISEPLSALL